MNQHTIYCGEAAEEGMILTFSTTVVTGLSTISEDASSSLYNPGKESWDRLSPELPETNKLPLALLPLLKINL